MTPVARAFTSVEADEIFVAYNRAFYFTNGNQGFYHVNTDGGKTWFWERAKQMEKILHVHDRTTNPACMSANGRLIRSATLSAS